MNRVLRNYTAEQLNNAFRRKQTALTLARQKRFETIDFYEIVNDYRDSMGSPLAGFFLYVDHTHFSALGVDMVAGKILPSLSPSGTQSSEGKLKP